MKNLLLTLAVLGLTINLAAAPVPVYRPQEIEGKWEIKVKNGSTYILIFECGKCSGNFSYYTEYGACGNCYPGPMIKGRYEYNSKNKSFIIYNEGLAGKTTIGGKLNAGTSSGYGTWNLFEGWDSFEMNRLGNSSKGSGF